jgi:hypothetical protein
MHLFTIDSSLIKYQIDITSHHTGSTHGRSGGQGRAYSGARGRLMGTANAMTGGEMATGISRRMLSPRRTFVRRKFRVA